MIDINNSTKEELLAEYEQCEQDWGMLSCDCFGYYIKDLHKRIVELGGWL